MPERWLVRDGPVPWLYYSINAPPTQQNFYFVALATTKRISWQAVPPTLGVVPPPTGRINKILVLFRLGCCPPSSAIASPSCNQDYRLYVMYIAQEIDWGTQFLLAATVERSVTPPIEPKPHATWSIDRSPLLNYLEFRNFSQIDFTMVRSGVKIKLYFK